MMEQKQNGKNIRLIAVDMDGTLLSNEKTLSQKNEKALNQAISKGIFIVPATGRPVAGLPKAILENEKILYAICSNGAAVVNLKEKKVIYKNYLKRETAIQLIKMLNSFNIIIDVFADGKIFTEYRNLKRLDKFMIPANMIQYIHDTRTCTDDIINLLQTNQLNIEKINMFFQNMDIRNKTEEILSKIPEISVTSSLNSNMEINNSNANKGSGLKWLTKHLNLQMNQVMALGDSDNDMDMLKAAGLAVAMRNGTDAIKSIADYVTLSNEQNGVSEAIRMIL